MKPPSPVSTLRAEVTARKPTNGAIVMRRLNVALLAVLLLVACGGQSEEEAQAEAIASRTPQGTEEARAAFDNFMDQPFITDEQVEQSRDMVWRACAALQEGATWQEVEDQELAAIEAQGRALSPIEISGMRTAAGLGLAAYCPQHEDAVSG